MEDKQQLQEQVAQREKEYSHLQTATARGGKTSQSLADKLAGRGMCVFM